MGGYRAELGDAKTYDSLTPAVVLIHRECYDEVTSVISEGRKEGRGRQNPYS